MRAHYGYSSIPRRSNHKTAGGNRRALYPPTTLTGGKKRENRVQLEPQPSVSATTDEVTLERGFVDVPPAVSVGRVETESRSNKKWNDVVDVHSGEQRHDFSVGTTTTRNHQVSSNTQVKPESQKQYEDDKYYEYHHIPKQRMDDNGPEVIPYTLPSEEFASQRVQQFIGLDDYAKFKEKKGATEHPDETILATMPTEDASCDHSHAEERGPEEVSPGAMAVHGVGGATDDDSNTIVIGGSVAHQTEHTEERPTLASAWVVDENAGVGAGNRLASGRHGNRWIIDLSDRRVICVLATVLVAVAALAVGVSLAVISSRGDGGGNDDSGNLVGDIGITTSPTTAMPTTVSVVSESPTTPPSTRQPNPTSTMPTTISVGSEQPTALPDTTQPTPTSTMPTTISVGSEQPTTPPGTTQPTPLESQEPTLSLTSPPTLIQQTPSPTLRPNITSTLPPTSSQPLTPPPTPVTPPPTQSPSPRPAPNPTPEPTLAPMTSKPTAKLTPPPTPKPPTLPPTLSPTPRPTPNPTTQAPTPPPTPQPTPIPTTEQEACENFIESVALGDGSAQNQARDWLCKEPAVGSYSDETMIERYALATIYFSTDGPGWYSDVNWLASSSVCGPEWDHVNCVGGVVTEFLPDADGLSGTLPPEIGLLESVIVLDFSDNNLSGTIPKEIGRLRNLEELDLRRNDLSGGVHDDICILKDTGSLQYLFVDSTISCRCCTG